jgi:hypothetical protein
MNFILAPIWIVDEWLFDPSVHGILYNVMLEGVKSVASRVHPTSTCSFAKWII